MEKGGDPAFSVFSIFCIRLCFVNVWGRPAFSGYCLFTARQQRLLLYRSACCLFTARHTMSTSVPFRLLSLHRSAYSVYFCTVPLAAFSLLGIQRLLLYRSAAASGGTQLRPHVLRSGQRKKARAGRRALKTE